MAPEPTRGDPPPPLPRDPAANLPAPHPPALPPDEPARLARLQRLDVLDSPSEREFDDIVFMASMVSGCSMAAISFVDSDRTWNKATFGPLRRELSRASSLAAVAISSSDPTVVADASVDSRLRHHEVGSVRLYAAFPLRASADPAVTSAVGVLCVMDGQPRVLDDAQLDALAALARQTERLLELRVALADARAEQETIALSEERFRLALDGLVQGILVVDRTGHVVSANPAAAAILGLRSDQLIGLDTRTRNWTVHDADGSVHPRERLNSQTRTIEDVSVTDELVHVDRLDGTFRWLMVNARPFADPVTHEQCAVVSFLDVTESQDLNNRLRDSLARLTAASRERAALISAVAHDLRAPVASMRLMADLLDDPKGVLTPQRRSDLLSRLRLEAATTESALGDLVAADRLSGGLLAPRRSLVDVRALVRRRVDLVFTESHHLELHLPEDDLVLWADRAQLERVIDNLLGNGLKHTPAGSRLVVTAEDRGDAIAVVVEDDGPGVPTDVRGQLFNAYTRGADAARRPGSGIGLYLVHEFARFHGGRASYEDSPLGGARFVVTFAKASGVEDEPAGLAD
jgi:PAS domain S-box-containing protein